MPNRILLPLATFALLFLGSPLYAVTAPTPLPDDPKATDEDRQFMKQAFALAEDAMKKGNGPFGALMVQDHKVIFEYENTMHTTKDATKHAETGLVSAATPKFPREVFLKSTLYTSTEPCTMCSGAIHWAGFRRVVYGVQETQMQKLMPGLTIPTNPLTCREVLSRIAPGVEVVGPLMEGEGLKVHIAFWPTRIFP